MAPPAFILCVSAAFCPPLRAHDVRLHSKGVPCYTEKARRSNRTAPHREAFLWRSISDARLRRIWMPRSSFTTMSAALWRPVQTARLAARRLPHPHRAPRAQASGALYLAWDGARAIGSMVLNHDADPDYAQVPGWGPDADWPHLLLIHTLAVHPRIRGGAWPGGCSPCGGPCAAKRHACASPGCLCGQRPCHPPV